jgi:hypothetical protein
LSTQTVSIIVSGVVAVAAIAATWHQSLRGLGHERKLVDLDNVRDILDEAAVALHASAYVLDDVRSDLTQYGGVTFFKTDAGSKIYKLLGSQGRGLDALIERLSVRLGRDCDVVVAFKAADEAVLGVWQAVGLLRLEPEGDGSSSAASALRELNDQKRREVEAHREAFAAAREKFVAAAYNLAGARL